MTFQIQDQDQDQELNGNLAPVPTAAGVLGQLERGRAALQAAVDDWERLRIRDAAAALQAAAEVLRRRDVQVLAAELVCDAERAVALANPPATLKRKVDRDSGSRSTSQDTIRQLRRAHNGLTDADYAAVKAAARESGAPLTRRALIARRPAPAPAPKGKGKGKVEKVRVRVDELERLKARAADAGALEVEVRHLQAQLAVLTRDGGRARNGAEWQRMNNIISETRSMRASRNHYQDLAGRRAAHIQALERKVRMLESELAGAAAVAAAQRQRSGSAAQVTAPAPTLAAALADQRRRNNGLTDAEVAELF